jgi:hypothetical protein
MVHDILDSRLFDADGVLARMNEEELKSSYS